MSGHYSKIYASKAPKYDKLVSREDFQGHILPALEGIRPLAGLDVIEFGAGTGRLTRMLAPLVKSIRAFDISQHMLDTAAERLAPLEKNWELAVGDNRNLPVDDHVADLSISGWSLSYFIGLEEWREEIGSALNEMLRVVKPGGTVIVIETLGTGNETPAPPNEGLAAYYRVMESEYGFDTTWIRTDYKFDSLEEADDLTRFFFGDELANRVVRENLVILPECTGIWWKYTSA